MFLSEIYYSNIKRSQKILESAKKSLSWSQVKKKKTVKMQGIFLSSYDAGVSNKKVDTFLKGFSVTLVTLPKSHGYIVP